MPRMHLPALIRTRRPQHKGGFTIVELLIVIVVIGILAVIATTAFTSAQARSRDSRRLADINAILKAIKAHKADLGYYPVATPSGGGRWDASSDFNNGHVFLANLKSSGFMPQIPVDPVNTSLDIDNNTGMHYNYFTYEDDWYLASIGCTSGRGRLTVLMIVDLETSSRPAPQSPGFSCAGRNFNNEADWVWGDYEF
ncbi:prepilin-type N-terminal cleavage/methylation domain-containing protein [Candidatus Saccharibacteria bacterium]|nr:prepilin-type N-terminal cleavage/methylation domain-containing protein [Candidatus Saccharibacteria bacterium]